MFSSNSILSIQSGKLKSPCLEVTFAPRRGVDGVLITEIKRIFVQVGVKHIVLAVSYRAEMLEQEMKLEADKVRGLFNLMFL